MQTVKSPKGEIAATSLMKPPTALVMKDIINPRVWQITPIWSNRDVTNLENHEVWCSSMQIPIRGRCRWFCHAFNLIKLVRNLSNSTIQASCNFTHQPWRWFCPQSTYPTKQDSKMLWDASIHQLILHSLSDSWASSRSKEIQNQWILSMLPLKDVTFAFSGLSTCQALLLRAPSSEQHLPAKT